MSTIPPSKSQSKPKPEPIQKTLSQRYEALAAKLGDLQIKKKRILEAIEEVEAEILSLDSLASFILAAERNGMERAMDDYKRASQGRKEPKSYHHAPKAESSKEPENE